MHATFRDLDNVTVDVGVDPSACLSASASLELRGNSSWLAGAMADGANRAGPDGS